jgi:imidazolonepropionase-like amidohydrolase
MNARASSKLSHFGRTLVKRLSLFLMLLFAVPGIAQNAVAIRAGAVVDPSTGSIAKNQVILVENGKIKEIGPNVRIPNGAAVVDLSNEWISPGLMDAHVHLTLTEVTGGNAPFESFYLKESSTYRGLRGLRNAQDLLRAGFTTLREVGNDGNYATEDVKRAIQSGMFDGPTILTAGKIIAPFGGQSTAIPPEQGPFWRYEYIDADTPEEVRKAVRQNIYYGVDWWVRTLPARSSISKAPRAASSRPRRFWPRKSSTACAGPTASA